MTTHDFLNKVKNHDLLSSKKVKVKKHWWDKAPSLHPIGSANFIGNDLVFHVSEYGELKMDKIIESIEEKQENGMVRVGSFKIHYIQPTFEGFNLVIHKNAQETNKNSIFNWFFGFAS
jgi:hypothetical protein